MFRSVILVLVLAGCVFAHELRMRNNCHQTIWIGLLGNPGKGNPENGGFQLNGGQTHSVQVGQGWVGRVWGRTECDGSGHCVTGDCGNKIKCGGAGGIPPATLAEIGFDGWQGQDFYDISLVDGYNLPAKIIPIPGTFKKSGNGKYDCNVAGCNSDLNSICPGELAMKHNGKTVACKSACLVFNTDEYCCRGAHNKPETCKSSSWPKNYPATFKRACPDAYSYAYDDTSSTFTCRSSGNANSGYEIVFC